MNMTFVSQDDNNHFVTDSSSNDIQTAIQLLYQSSFPPAYFPRLLHLFVEQTFRALCLTQQESEMTYPVPLPADYAEMLEALAADPLFRQFLGDRGTLQQWHAVLAFAQRCDYMYGRAHNEAKSAFQAYPQTALTDLAREDVKERLTHWHHPHPFDVPEKYRHAYQVIPRSTEAAEQVVMQRWYRRGFERGVIDAAAIQHQAWTQAEDAPQEEAKQDETNRDA